MIDFNTAIELIRRNGGFKPNRRDTSYYRTYTMEDSRPMQARVSNHGTWLWTWYDKDYDPSYAINTCVVYSENGEDKSDVSVDMEIKDEEGNVVGERKSFEVTQYVYNCQILDDNDAALINQAVQNIWQNKGFKDPLANTNKHAKVMILRPNETPEIITETRYTNMNKKLIRLTESDLHSIVKESVNYHIVVYCVLLCVDLFLATERNKSLENACNVLLCIVLPCSVVFCLVLYSNVIFANRHK